MISYNADMRKNSRTTERGRETLTGTVVVIGGFFCALLLSRVRIHGLHTPLSLGLLLGSQLAGFDPAPIVGGVILGAFSESRPYWQGVAVALLYWGVTRIVLLIRKKCRPAFRVLIYLVCALITLPVSAVYGMKELLYGLISLSVSVLSAICFRRISVTVRTMHSARMTTETEQGAIVLGIGMLLLAVSDAKLIYWSLPVSLILLFTATAVSARGVFGAAAGTLWSVMLVLYAKTDPVLIGSVALGALGAASVREKGKLFIGGAFVLSGVLFQSFLKQQAYGMSVPNLLSAMLIYLILPKDWLEYLRAYTDPRRHTDSMIADAVRRTELRASRELERMGKLLGGLSGMFYAAPEENDSVALWTVQGALSVCRGCEYRRDCWNDADAMREAVVSLAKEAEQGTRLRPTGSIDEACERFDDLCASVLLAYQQAANRDAVRTRARNQSGFAERQLSGAGAALCACARRMRNRARSTGRRERKIRDRLTEAGYRVEHTEIYASEGTETVSVQLRRPLRSNHSAVQRETEQACGYELRCIRVAQNKNRVSFEFERNAAFSAAAQVYRTAKDDAVSGDATGECRFPDGRVCFALSDGMGSGKTARRESEAAIRLLFRLYHAGVQKELVYENVNRMLMAQNETEMYATLDAVSIDLNSGEAELLKYGAPPSFLVRDGQVSAITGEALPCGILAEAKPSVIRIRVKRNDRIVLCSDGVQDVLPEGMEEAIRSAAADPGKTGDALLRLAQSRGGTDDMTVMVIRVA